MGDEVKNTKKEGILMEIRRVREALKKTDSQHLKRDYGKYLRRLEKTLAALMIILLLIACTVAGAESQKMWVLCNPKSYVVIREKPKKNAKIGGYLYLGDEVETDGKIQNGYAHIPHTSTESGEGWVSVGYLDNSESRQTNKSAKAMKKETCARGCIDGEVKKRLKKGTVIKVFAENQTWSVTSVGYIRSELLEEVLR